MMMSMETKRKRKGKMKNRMKRKMNGWKDECAGASSLLLTYYCWY